MTRSSSPVKPHTKATKIAGEAEQRAACPLAALPRFLHWSSRCFYSLHPAGLWVLREPHVCQMLLKLGIADEGVQACTVSIASCRRCAPME